MFVACISYGSIVRDLTTASAVVVTMVDHGRASAVLSSMNTDEFSQYSSVYLIFKIQWLFPFNCSLSFDVFCFFLSSRDWRPSSHCALKTALFFNWLQAFAQLPVQEPDSLVLSWDMAYPIELLVSNGWLARSWIPPASDYLKMTEAWLFIPVKQSFIQGLFERFREFLGQEISYSTRNPFF